jgi:hypothetical protein
VNIASAWQGPPAASALVKMTNINKPHMTSLISPGLAIRHAYVEQVRHLWGFLARTHARTWYIF